jgi:hypothetical protein
VIAVSYLGALAATLPLVGFNLRETGRTRPVMRNAKRAANRLDQAAERVTDQVSPGRQFAADIAWNVPEPGLKGQLEVLRNNVQYAGSSSPQQKPAISMNPNIDRSYLAHEMGHLVSQKTDVGHLAASLRANPKLKKALLGALVTVPGVAAAMQSGNDDLDDSIALAALTQVPTITDEALATKQGLAIMDNAGMRASLGQRGRLAGGLLSYLAAPVIIGTAGNAVGNMLD